MPDMRTPLRREGQGQPIRAPTNFGQPISADQFFDNERVSTMSENEKGTVRVSVTVEVLVEEAQWCRVRGVTAEEVPADVRKYVRLLVGAKLAVWGSIATLVQPQPPSEGTADAVGGGPRRPPPCYAEMPDDRACVLDAGHRGDHEAARPLTAEEFADALRQGVIGSGGGHDGQPSPDEATP